MTINSKVIGQGIQGGCVADRKILINSLKSIGNAGLYSDENAIQTCLDRNDEIAVEAVNALRRSDCNDFRYFLINIPRELLFIRFDQLKKLVENKKGDLEVRQNAYLRLWDCPSIELANFAEAQYLRESSENMKNLILSHHYSEALLTDKKSSSLFSSLEEEKPLNPQMSQIFDLEMNGYGFDIKKLNNPGSILPRSVEANIKSAAFGMDSYNAIGAKLRMQNLENGLISVFHPENETKFDDSREEERQRQSLGLDEKPRFRLDFTVFDNDIYSLDIDDMRSVLDELAEDWRKMTEMSAIEKMKARV